MADVVVVGAGLIDLHKLVVRAGSVEGARTLFERLVNDIVRLEHPEARSIAASPGDWGIDALIGDMDGGNLGIWQSKFYLDKTETKHKPDIISSYNMALAKAEEHKYALTSWTLCVPSDLTPSMNKWWQGSKKQREKQDKVAIDLWDYGQLCRRLLRPGEEVRAVRDYWFNPIAPVPGQPDSVVEPLDWQAVIDEEQYDDFLFVHQLSHANMTETRGAREAFFNAEILEGEVADKAVPREMSALRSWRARVGAAWENKFNSIAAATTGQQLPGLYENVMADIDPHHHENAKALRAQLLHGQGLMHQQVEGARAGWVRNWRDIAADHGAVATRNANVSSTASAMGSETSPSANIGGATASSGSAAPDEVGGTGGLSAVTTGCTAATVDGLGGTS